MRGKHNVRPAVHVPHRITPACAGKTIRGALDSYFQEDHPRVCGENPSRSALPSSGRGSPPRVRGKHLFPDIALILAGITPACAGKTRPPPLAHLTQKDHPRVCGENYGIDPAKIVRPGSPPRVRGKLHIFQGFHARTGITPACAGKTGRAVAHRHRVKDHPRVCGENNRCHAVGVDYIGSPPRVRGKLLLAFACFFI